MLKNDVVFGRNRVPPLIPFHRFFGPPYPPPLRRRRLWMIPYKTLKYLSRYVHGVYQNNSLSLIYVQENIPLQKSSRIKNLTSASLVDNTDSIAFKTPDPKKTGPWNGHSSLIFPSQKPEGLSKNGNNTICLS